VAAFNMIVGLVVGWHALQWSMIRQLFNYFIGWSLTFDKTQTPHGKLPTYNKPAQEWGARIIFLQLGCSIFLLLKRLFYR